MDATGLEAIRRAAAEQGIDPATALAIAERESNFDPKARSSKTIRGIFQMRGDLRKQYGVGDSDDPYAQAKGWGAFFRDVKRDMSGSLGRDASDAEGYLGHHFGAKRAARMMSMDPATPVDQVFTREERRLNPHFDKAGTVGALNSTVLADIGKRQAKFGAAPADYSEAGSPADRYLKVPTGTSALDFSSFGAPADVVQTSLQRPPSSSNVVTNAPQPQPSVQQPTGAPDFSPFGVPA